MGLLRKRSGFQALCTKARLMASTSSDVGMASIREVGPIARRSVVDASRFVGRGVRSIDGFVAIADDDEIIAFPKSTNPFP